MSDSRKPSGVYVVVLASTAAVGGFLFGYDSGVINGTVHALQEAFHTGEAGTGFAVASVLLGCAAGAFVAGNLADRFGRRPMMLVTAVVFLLASVGTGAAGNVTVFNVFRLIGGLAVGAASVLAPAYIAEISPAHVRGRLASLQQFAIVLGLFSSFLCNYLIARAAGGAEATFWMGFPAWRWMFWVEAIPSAVFLVGALLIPESPRFLVAHGRPVEAKDVFGRAVGGDVDQLVREVQASLAGAPPSRIADVFEPGRWNLRPIVWVGIVLAMFQQFVGINLVFYYGEVLWKAAGASEQAALQFNLVTGLTNIGATIVAILLIDRLGRKPLLVAGSVGMALTMAILAVTFSTGRIDEEGRLQLAPAMALTGSVAINLYIVAFAVSWGPVVWVMLGEMFSNRFRAAALAVAAAAQWLANFLVTVTFPPLLAAVGLPGVYGIYAGASVLSLLFVLRFIRETKGKRLEEM